MSHHLEREFPAVRWQATLPRGFDHELGRAAIARARRLRSVTIRNGVRAAFRAVAEFVRFGAHGIARRLPGREHRAPASHGA